MTNILTEIFAVFASVGNWIVQTLPTFFGLFYVAETGLTLLGSLAVVGLGFSVVFLLIGIITSFLKFRA